MSKLARQYLRAVKVWGPVDGQCSRMQMKRLQIAERKTLKKIRDGHFVRR